MGGGIGTCWRATIHPDYNSIAFELVYEVGFEQLGVTNELLIRARSQDSLAPLRLSAAMSNHGDSVLETRVGGVEARELPDGSQMWLACVMQ